MTLRKTHLDGFAAGILLICCLFWGFQQVLVKATIAEVPPVFQAAIRFAGATVLLWLWSRWRGINLFGRDGSLRVGLLVGGLFSMEFACLYAGLQYSSASRVTVFLYTSPFWVAVLLPFFVKSETLRPVQWLGLGLAFVAVMFALQGGQAVASQPQQWLGDLLGLCGGMFWGFTTLTIRSTRLSRMAPEKLLFYQITVSTVVLFALSWALGERWVWTFSAFAGMSLAVQAAAGAFASFLVWVWLLGRYPATKISAFVFLTPVFALLFGALWLNEAVTLNLVAALALVATGIVLVNRRPAA